MAMKCHRSLAQRSGVRFIVACGKQPRKQHSACALIFGDPKAGTPLMNWYPSLALRLPIKVLVWESQDGAVWLCYNSPEFLQERHGLDNYPFGVLTDLVAAAGE